MGMRMMSVGQKLIILAQVCSRSYFGLKSQGQGQPEGHASKVRSACEWAWSPDSNEQWMSSVVQKLNI